jgi:hypothetical protein
MVMAMTFNPVRTLILVCAALSGVVAQNAAQRSDSSTSDMAPAPLGAPTTLTTLAFDSEGLTVDPGRQILYAAEAPNAAGDCIVRSITLSGVVSAVGAVPKPLGGACGPRGLEFRAGRLYIADQGVGAEGWVFEMDPSTGQATVFAEGVPGANGIAFDARGNLWITDSLRGFGRVYKRDALTGLVQEAFRVPPVANGTIYGGQLITPTTSGIGRQIINLPVGTQSEVRQVANGIAVVERQDAIGPDLGKGWFRNAAVYVADTARGAIWAVRLDEFGNVLPGQTGCDPTLQTNTLCDDALVVAHPRLEGADGMVVDRDGSLLLTANARQALIRFDGRTVTELFRNPFNSQLLRSSADTAEGNRHILEYPSNPIIVPSARWPYGQTVCVTSIDRGPRDNWPAAAGEIGGPGQPKGKISCF